MYIRNIKTGIVQECTNKDVIKVCRRDSENYVVSEGEPVTQALEVIEEVTVPEMSLASEKNLEDMTVSELKALAKEKGIDGTSSLAKEDLLAVLKEVK